MEDNEDIRFMLASVLGAAGYEVSSVAGPGEVAGIARIKQFDLFILDNKFDEGRGVDLCRTLRVICPDTPVLFYSAAAYDCDREEALRAGACAYVAKPGIEELVGAVRRALTADN